MIRQTIRIVVFLLVILILQSGCGIARNSHKPIEEAIVVKKLVQSSQSWDGALLPAYPQGQPQITILRITIPAGARLETHHHPVINAGVLIRGELLVKKKDGQTLLLRAGDPLVEVVSTSHYGMNQGAVPAEIIVFYAGIVDAPITVVEPR